MQLGEHSHRNIIARPADAAFVIAAGSKVLDGAELMENWLLGPTVQNSLTRVSAFMRGS